MKRICIYTAITGNYDQLNEIKNPEKNVDYLCFTNNKNLKSKTWKIIYIEDKTLDNQRLSRKIKMLGHPIIDKNYEISVWMDARIIFDKKVSDFVKTYLKDAPFVAFKHHMRNCIYEEAYECIKRKKDSKEQILKHIDFLKKEGYPAQNGLCEMTVFIRKVRDKSVRKTMELWYSMVLHYSKRDQLSFMYAVWKTKMPLTIIDMNVWDNPWFHHLRHNYKETLDTCRIYFGDDTNFDPARDLQPSYQKKGNQYQVSVVIPSDTTCIEIELTDIPCVSYHDLQLDSPHIQQIQYFNTIDALSKHIFYSESGLVQLKGNFKKGETISFSIVLEPLDTIERLMMIEEISIQKILATQEKENFKNQCRALQEEITSIKSRKIYKIAAKLGKIKNLFRKG